jgi:hypothetical protein
LVSVVLKNNNYTSKALHTLVFGEGIASSNFVLFLLK